MPSVRRNYLTKIGTEEKEDRIMLLPRVSRLLIIGLLFNCFSLPVLAQSPDTLSLRLTTTKRTYRLNEQLKFSVSLMNYGSKSVYILAELGFGYRSSFVLKILDSNGKEIESSYYPDDSIFSSPDDQSAFLELLPDHFLGTIFFAPTREMIHKPGKYALFVEYRPRFSVKEVKVHPFWGEENGMLKSNVLHIDVTGRRRAKKTII